MARNDEHVYPFANPTMSIFDISTSDIFTPETEQQLWKLLTAPQSNGYGSPLEEFASSASEFMKTPEGSACVAILMKTMMGNQMKGAFGKAPSAFGN